MSAPISCSVELDNNDPASGTFTFEGERHTLANPIKQTLAADPAVEFCAYSVPHPAQNRMKIKIQAKEGENVVNIMNNGLDNFSTWCENVENQFDNAMKGFIDA